MRLHVFAAKAQSMEAQKLYNSAIPRLLGEFQRTVLALKRYREPTPQNNVTLVKQQNVAQSQQIALLDGHQPTEKISTREPVAISDTKLRTEAIRHEPKPRLTTQPQKSSGRQAEQDEATRADG